MQRKRSIDEEEAGRISALKEALDVYLSGRSGIRFDSLMRFAGPLFDLYDVDWRSIGRPSARRDLDEISTMVAVLDVARLLWAFFALGQDDSIGALPELEDALLGAGAGDEERSNFLVLLSLLEEHWQQFTPEDRARAEDTPGYSLPEFETLLQDFPVRTFKLPTRAKNVFGPSRLDLSEALAIFAEPLLGSADLGSDPDLVEDRVARAQAYWELAMTPPDAYDEELERIIEGFARTSAERETIRAEAERMVQRFYTLFPEQRAS